jgi:ADP-heptose:LPS heptosyltransferase
MSVAHRLEVTLNMLPAEVPYVEAPWDRAVDPRLESGPQPRVGVVWSGSRLHHNDRHRSCTLELFDAFLKHEGVDFFSLQKGAAEEELAGHGLVDLGNGFADFADAAAAVSRLDLLITVDTAVAHLAGAMGIPTWLLLPANNDWRWLAATSESPWYPGMRLFRQPRLGEWASVMGEVADELRRLYPAG